MNELVRKMKETVDLIEERLSSGMDCDSIECDSLLGELECLVHEARGAIDDSWRERARRIAPKLSLDDIDLEDIGL